MFRNTMYGKAREERDGREEVWGVCVCRKHIRAWDTEIWCGRVRVEQDVGVRKHTRADMCGPHHQKVQSGLPAMGT